MKSTVDVTVAVSVDVVVYRMSEIEQALNREPSYGIGIGGRRLNISVRLSVCDYSDSCVNCSSGYIWSDCLCRRGYGDRDTLLGELLRTVRLRQRIFRKNLEFLVR